MSIRKRGKGVYQLVIDAPSRQGERRQVYRTVRGTLDDAKKAHARLLLEVGRGDAAGGDDTVESLVDKWLRLKERALQPRSVDYYRQGIALLPDWLRVMPVWKVRPVHVDQAYTEMLANGRTAESVLKAHRSLRAAFSQAVKWRFVEFNPCKAATPPAVPKKKLPAPTPDIVKRAIAAMPPDLACWMLLAATNGGRRGEVAGLRRSDIDLVERTVTYQRQAVTERKKLVVKETTKSHRDRVVPLSDLAARAVSDMLARQDSTALKHLDVALGPDAFLFARDPLGERPRGGDWGANALRYHLRKRGLGKIRMHDLRRFVSTYLTAAGHDPVTTAAILGHDPAVTLSVYASKVDGAQRRAAAEMDSILG